MVGMSCLSRRVLCNLLSAAGRRCQVCAAVLPDARHGLLCADCARLLAPRRGGYCPRCGICFADPSASIHACLACRVSAPPWSGVAFHSPYAGVLKDLVHRFKFGRDLGVARLLGELLHDAWLVHGLDLPDLLVPVPMRPGRLVWRGFNQSVELARMLGRRIGVPVVVDGLTKMRDTVPQSTLNREERSRNVVGVFMASSRVAGRSVTLVDDVMTTGSTLTACAKACLDAGAACVSVAVLGRAL
ncbi:MAG: ComF family protein [Deltaproteobacteria bacterium]|nr:ComF family protein [Deltaproteobacteria bacterium]